MNGLRTGPRRIALHLLLAAPLALAACVGYSKWPPDEGSKVPSNPNFNEMRLAMTKSLAWAVDRYPPGPLHEPVVDTPVAINLPDGVREGMYRIVVDNVSDRAQPLTPENTHLPIYHITRVEVIGDDGTVDIARPVSGWGTDEPVYQGITIRVRGGPFKDWKVTSHRLWTVGAMEVPEYHYIPGSAPEVEEEEVTPATDEAPAPAEAADAVEPEAPDAPAPAPDAAPDGGDAPDAPAPDATSGDKPAEGAPDW
jgi:hypothetical protein